MARLLDSEGIALKEITEGMQPNVGRWLFAYENPTTQPPTLQVQLGEQDEDFDAFYQNLAVPDDWQTIDAALLYLLTQQPPVIELTEDLLALLPPDKQLDPLDRLQRRMLVENVVEDMGKKQGIRLRRSSSTPPTV